jgi:hypothetical protein
MPPKSTRPRIRFDPRLRTAAPASAQLPRLRGTPGHSRVGRAASSFFGLPGATSACTGTTVRCSWPPSNTPGNPRRKPRRQSQRMRNGSARHSGVMEQNKARRRKRMMAGRDDLSVSYLRTSLKVNHSCTAGEICERVHSWGRANLL